MFKYLKNKSGASMIIVIIVAVIFLVLGVGVLVAASVSASASVKNRDNKQLYYYAKSAADTIDDSIKVDNGLGNEIINIIATMMINNLSVPNEITLNSNITLTHANGISYEGLTYEDVCINLEGISSSKTYNYSGSNGTYYVEEMFNLNITKVTVSFITKYMGLEYLMIIDYVFNAQGVRNGYVTGNEPVVSINDLDINSLPDNVSWESFERTFIKVYQGG